MSVDSEVVLQVDEPREVSNAFDISKGIDDEPQKVKGQGRWILMFLNQLNHYNK